jgi:F-type H+-transporting ATPase subunit delta
VTSERTKLESYAHALFEIARGEGLLGGVEDDMFRFARTLEGSDALRLALTDPSLPVERRIGVIEELTGGKALPVSTALLSMLVAAGQASELPQIVDRFVELAAAEREHEVAEVRSAIPLDTAQMQRLATALGRATGKDVEVKVIVDPTVLGGLVARIGDTVIDGSVRHRLEQMKERHA